MAALEVDDPLGLTGKTLADTYQLLAPIGQGGFGAVYRAKHLMMNRALAVKVQKTSVDHRQDLVDPALRSAELVTSTLGAHSEICGLGGAAADANKS